LSTQASDDESAPGESGQPEREGSGGERDRPHAGVERGDRDAGEENAEHEEECAQGAPLRRPFHGG
jgi:hypothetical protein